MEAEIEPGDWSGLDPWWHTHADSFPAERGATSAGVLAPEHLADSWTDVDSWWPAYADTYAGVQGSASAKALTEEQLVDSWNDLDPWWDVYNETGHATAIELADLLTRSNAEWERSDGPFDTDPLAADLTLKRLSQGPLQPTNEMGWSRWLARLLRPSKELVAELFDVAVDQPPDEVVREAQLTKQDDQSGPSRRADILVFYADNGISIEVKLGDESYRKTAHTARLAENRYEGRDWSHAILLPERKSDRLGSIVGPSIEPGAGGTPQIEWNDPGPVSVIYWSDVTAAIRSILRRGDAVDNHWAANAYLFCAVAEQQLMRFQPQSVVDQMATPSNVVDSIQPIQLSGILEEQLTYLRAVVEP